MPGNRDLAEQAELFWAVTATETAEEFEATPGISRRESTTVSKIEASEIEAPVVTRTRERRIWSVRTLVSDIRSRVETEYEDLWVEGEISNCRTAPSGHLYLTLKDGEAQLPVVLFRRQAILLRFRPVDGLAVLIRGRISLYESRGQLQLIAESMEPRGTGALQLAFEQLKARLLAEGLFDSERKRPLPAFPKCIGVVTSPTGAVIRDIVTIVQRRHSPLDVLVYPAIVQGPGTAASVIEGIRWFNSNPSLVDVIVIARGGGSPEDLAGFNDEDLAREIAGSQLPVISAVGHETDFTIADFAADLRAPTPSAASELITAAQHRIEERIDALRARMERAGHFQLVHARQQFSRLSSDSVLNRLRDAVSRRDERLDELRVRLDGLAERWIGFATRRHLLLAERVRRQDPSVRIGMMNRRLQNLDEKLRVSVNERMVMRRHSFGRTSARLHALSPLAVLSRGYALVYNADGSLLRSAAETFEGRTIRARLARGTVEAKVTHTSMDEATAMENRDR